MAEIILEGLGGKENIISIDNCVTRLRLEIKDKSKINEKLIKSSGASGIIKPGKKRHSNYHWNKSAICM